MGARPSKVQHYNMLVVEEEFAQEPQEHRMVSTFLRLSRSQLCGRPHPQAVSPSRGNLGVPAMGDSSVVTSPSITWLVKQYRLQPTDWMGLSFGTIVGQGRLGLVRLARLRDHEQFFVVKAVRKDRVVQLGAEALLRSEKLVLGYVDSAFCCRLFGTHVDRRRLYLALEFCPGGTLASLLRRRYMLPPQEMRFYVAELLCALEHIHARGIVHRDLHPDSVCLDELGHVKLVGWSLARTVPPAQRLHTQRSRPSYSAPELLDLKLACGYDQSVDCWALGVLAFELVTGKLPFGDEDCRATILRRIQKDALPLPRHITDVTCVSLLRQLLQRGARSRVRTVQEAQSHPFFSVAWTSVRERRVLPPYAPVLVGVGDCSYFAEVQARPEKAMKSQFIQVLDDC